MKRIYIWILTSVMAVLFTALITVQVTLIKNSAHERSKQFTQNVSHALTSVINHLEEIEIREYVNNERNKTYLHSQNTSVNGDILSHEEVYVSISGSYSDLGPSKGMAASPKVPDIDSKLAECFTQGNDISSTNVIIQQHLNLKREIKGMRWQEVMARMEYELKSKPLKERLDTAILNAYLSRELRNAGITAPYYYKVLDSKGQTVFSSSCGYPDDDSKPFKHVLFPRDGSYYNTNPNFIYVYFPTRQKEIFKSMKMAMPSFLLTFMLVLTFIYTIYVVFRQKRLSEIKNDFVNNMTHELKTPISTISLASQMLKDGGVSKTPQTLSHITGVIHDETKRLSFQVEKVLQMAIFDRDSTRLKLKALDANDLLENVVSNFSIKVQNHGGNIEAELGAAESIIQADEVHLTNVFHNLLDNAVKYKREQPNILIKTWSDKQKLFISVKDNGLGIKKEDLKRIFEKFYRVPTGNVHNVKGFGLGLAYVKKIVEDHKGSIKAESEINIGTTFTICLPLK